MKLQDELLAASAHCDYERDYRAIKKAAAQLDLYEAALREWRNRCEYLLACIDMSNEAGAPVDESDPEDIAAIDEIRTALNSTDTGA